MNTILIPFRDRAEHLKELIPVLKQRFANTPYQVVVVEQKDDKPFNRGKLFNVGASFLAGASGTLFLHDVDLVPLQADYTNITGPTHLSMHCTQFTHGAPPNYFGGVVAMPFAHFRRINGFNNDYWGWGAEDDDLRDRCNHHGLTIERRAGHYRSLPHAKAADRPDFRSTYGPNLARLIANRQPGGCEYDTNGMNSLVYKVGNVIRPGYADGSPDYTTIQVYL